MLDAVICVCTVASGNCSGCWTCTALMSGARSTRVGGGASSVMSAFLSQPANRMHPRLPAIKAFFLTFTEVPLDQLHRSFKPWLSDKHPPDSDSPVGCRGSHSAPAGNRATTISMLIRDGDSVAHRQRLLQIGLLVRTQQIELAADRGVGRVHICEHHCLARLRLLLLQGDIEQGALLLSLVA